MSSNEVTSKLLGRGGSVATTKEQTTVLGAVVDEEGNETGEMVTVRDEDRNAAMYLLGIQGSGKSSLIESMVYQDACKGHAIILLDPHYDLIKNVLSQLPQHRLKDTYLLDITDLDYPFGLNIFDATGLQNEAQAVDRVVSVFQKIFPSDHEGRLLKKMLKIITITLLSTPGMTLADIPRLLSDEAFRSYLGGNVTNRHVKRYWMEYNEMSKSGRDKEMYALKNRLSDILTNSMLENIIGQEKTTINFRRAIEEKQIILIKLPVGDYPDTAPLIGVGMVAELYRAIFSFADLPKEKRPGFSLYIDEFQNFATDDFAKIFTQARKYSVRTLVANQEREKITGENYSSVLTAFTMVAFRLTPKDARELGGRFVDYTKKVKLKKVHWDVLERLGEHQSEIIHQFWEEYVLPVQEEVKQLQRTVNAVSYDESEYNSPTPSRQLQSRQAYLKALTELLVYTQKKGFVVDTLLEKYLEMLDWYFGYESIGSQKLDIERVQKKLDTLQARKNFFDKLSSKELLVYYLEHFYHFFFANGDITRLVASYELHDKKFKEQVVSASRVLPQEKKENIFESIAKIISYNGSLDADVFKPVRQAIQQKEKEERKRIQQTIQGNRKYGWLNLANIHEVRENCLFLPRVYRLYHANWRKTISAPGFDFTKPLLFTLPRLSWGVWRSLAPVKLWDNQEALLVMYPMWKYRKRIDALRVDELEVWVKVSLEEETNFPELFAAMDEGEQKIIKKEWDLACFDAKEIKECKKKLEAESVLGYKVDAIYQEYGGKGALEKKQQEIQQRKSEWGTYEAFLDARKEEMRGFLNALETEITQIEKNIQKMQCTYESHNQRIMRKREFMQGICEILIEEPIGEKERPDTPADVAARIERLEPRFAYVRVGGSVFSMRTLDRPGVVGKEDYAWRLNKVRQQTRWTYGRKRADVERSLLERDKKAYGKEEKQTRQFQKPLQGGNAPAIPTILSEDEDITYDFEE